MQFRHEAKHIISRSDMAALRSRLGTICRHDEHADEGKYFIRSLYFDTPQDGAYYDNLNGVCNRQKFRIRFYNGDTSFVRLEKKIKRNSLGCKLSCPLTADEAELIADGRMEWARNDERQLLAELCRRHRAEGLSPRTVVDYTREPFVFKPGNVRVTLDYGIRTGTATNKFLDPDMPTLAVPGDPVILEVKWDDYLPTVIRDIVQLENCRSGAFSKYSACHLPINPHISFMR